MSRADLKIVKRVSEPGGVPTGALPKPATRDDNQDARIEIAFMEHLMQKHPRKALHIARRIRGDP